MNDSLLSPVVNEDRTIIFNLKCEFAKKVELGGEFKLGRGFVGPRASESVSDFFS